MTGSIHTVTILGATGSIGDSTLDVIARHEHAYDIYALSANDNAVKMAGLCQRWKPRYAVMKDCDAAQGLKASLIALDLDTEVLCGEDGLISVVEADEVDCVVAAIVGAAGLVPTLAAARKGKRILLANKEALVMSGKLFIDTARQNGATILPVDSEHNAIFQCLPDALMDDGSSVDRLNSTRNSGIERLLLTASGGPFRSYDAQQLEHVTPEQAVAHPNWNMGRKISVDSATLMNKGLELIEAWWLFDIDISCIEVVVHPQSVIHSMVSYTDGSVLAQMGNPDMRTPIAHALAWPERITSGVEPLDIFEVAKLEFERPDMQRFPCLRLCYEAIKRGGSATVVLNAANEIAVQAFLDGRIGFTGIAEVIEHALEQAEIEEDVSSLEAILAADAAARDISVQYVSTITKQSYEHIT
jgi:1-deoxy-D-xylulose-5-phosphate reductoisomerase